MMSCPAIPRSVATMARPLALLSWAGSYRPWGPGTVPKREWGGVSAIFDRPHSVVDVGMLGAGTPSARCWEGSAARPGLVRPSSSERSVRGIALTVVLLQAVGNHPFVGLVVLAEADPAGTPSAS